MWGVCTGASASADMCGVCVLLKMDEVSSMPSLSVCLMKKITSLL